MEKRMKWDHELLDRISQASGIKKETLIRDVRKLIQQLNESETKA